MIEGLPASREVHRTMSLREERKALSEEIKMKSDQDLDFITKAKQEEIRDQFAEHSGDLEGVWNSQLKLTEEDFVRKLTVAQLDYDKKIKAHPQQKEELLNKFTEFADSLVLGTGEIINQTVSGHDGWLSRENTDRLQKEAEDLGEALKHDPRYTALAATLRDLFSNDPSRTPNTETLYRITVDHAEEPEAQKLLWGILRKVTSQQRIDLLTRVAKDNPRFLEPLVGMATTADNAVFSGEEIATATEKHLKISPEKLKQISDNWEDYNTVKEQFYYDNGAATLESWNTPGLLLGAAKLHGLATAGANLFANMLYNRREWTKNPLVLIDRMGSMLTNEYFLLGTAEYLGAKAIENPEPLFASADEKIVAHRRFQKLVGNRYHNEQWESFMGLNDKAVGLKLLDDYTKSLGDIPEDLRPEDFTAFLELYKPDPDNPKQKVLDEKLLAVLQAANIDNPQEYLKEMQRKFAKIEDKNRLRDYLKTFQDYKIADAKGYREAKKAIIENNV